MMKRIGQMSFYFLILLLLSGCVTTSERSAYGSGREDLREESSLTVAPVLRFDDIPVPSGFKILDRASFSFQNDVTRVCLLKCTGNISVDQVVVFYKDQMPVYSWRPINIIEYERRVLNYEKDSESCIVTIESEGRRSILTIAISPKSRPMKVER